MLKESLVKNIWLIRHPETDWNAKKRYQGKSERPYSDKGKEELNLIVKYFNEVKVEEVFTSKRKRTKDLASAITSDREDIQIKSISELNEIDHGDWEGLTFSEVSKNFPNTYNLRFENVKESTSHNGESLNILAKRVLKAWEIIKKTKYSDIVIVTHATPIQVILCNILQISLDKYWQFKIDTGSITELKKVEDGFIICQLNQSLI